MIRAGHRLKSTAILVSICVSGVPASARFLQTDPVGYDDQVNLYVYVANDPVNGRDPKGTETCTGSPEACGAVRAWVALLADGATKTKSAETERLREVSGSTIGPAGKGAPIIIDKTITTGGNFDPADKSIHVNPALVANNLIGAGLIAHEGDHMKTDADTGPMKSLDDRRASEVSGYTTGNQFRATQNAYQVDPQKMAEKSIAIACAGSDHPTCK